MRRSAAALALAAVLALAPALSGCSACGCRIRTSHSQAMIDQLKAKRQGLKDERAFIARSLSLEAAREQGVSEKSSYYEYLRAKLARLDLEICSLNCEIYPY
jgi:hypothetical protein